MSEETTAAPTETSVAATVTTPTTPTDAPKWYGTVDTDTEKFIQNKGWKEPKDLLKSYQNLERLRGVGADKLVKLPESGNADETKAFYSRLGVPETPDAYEAPADLPFELDTKIVAGFSHKANLTPAQHETVTREIATYLKAAGEEQATLKAERDAAEKTALEREWGPVKDENYAAATKAAMKFGLDTEALNKLQEGLGYKGAIELLARIGRSFGEAKAPVKDPNSVSTPYGTTPQAAKERMDRLMTDTVWREKYFQGDRTAQEEWSNLKKVAFSDSRG